MKTWQQIGFQLEITADGSPSLRPLDPATGAGEAMHHSGGAFSESLAIYAPLIREVFDRFPSPGLLSVGLGLGYNEFLVAAEGRRKAKDYRLLSYESVPALRENLLRWLLEPERDSEIGASYGDILERVSAGDTVLARLIREDLLKRHGTGAWLLRGPLGEDSLPAGRFEGFLYDAFSSKTSPELWREEFLVRFLELAAAPCALLSTYACTGSLKRALARNGFRVEKRPGFQGKRNSTFAIRDS